MLVACDGWDRRECQTPGTPILNRVRPSRLFSPDEGRVGVNGLGVTLSRAYSSQLRDRLCENRAGIDWFRLLLSCLGRAGRHRRTGGNRSVPSLIPAFRMGCLPLQRMD